jgi:hypothetical protein
LIVQQLAQQQPRRIGADDRNLRTHRPIFILDEGCRNGIRPWGAGAGLALSRPPDYRLEPAAKQEG